MSQNNEANNVIRVNKCIKKMMEWLMRSSLRPGILVSFWLNWTHHLFEQRAVQNYVKKNI